MSPLIGDPGVVAGAIVHDAALSLAGNAIDPADRERYLEVAVRLGIALQPGARRTPILAASPFVLERSGRHRSLVEMIEADPGDDQSRFSLAMLLMRALIWEPAYAASPHPALLQDRELIRYRRQILMRRWDDLRRDRLGALVDLPPPSSGAFGSDDPRRRVSETDGG